MLKVKLIVGLASVILVMACGQKGGLVLPTEPAAQGRATLPQVLNPASPAAAPASSPASAPKR